MKTVTINIQKGGTGKTTLAVSLAYELSGVGKTMLIDADNQGNASSWLVGDKVSSDLALVLEDKMPIAKAMMEVREKALYLLPSVAIGGGLREYTTNQNPFRQMTAMRSLLGGVAELGFDYCIIDTGPRFGYIEEAAVACADEVITPIDPKIFGVEGLVTFAENIKQARKEIEGCGMTFKAVYKRLVVNNIMRSVKSHLSIIDQAKSNTSQIVYTLPQDQAFTTAVMEHKSIQACPNAKKETKEVLKRLADDLRSE